MTTSKQIQIAYVDDSPTELQRYAERLASRKVQICQFAPPADLDVSTIVRSKPDLFLLDYELTKAGASDARVAYRGGALAVSLRDAFPSHPIVLFTRKALFSRPEYGQLKDIRPVFDDRLFKHSVDQDPETARETLADLALGFGKMRQKRNRNWAALMQLLDAEPDESDLLVKAGPPLSKDQPEGTPTTEWRVTEGANWVRGVALAFPGILYDPLHAATALGIDVDSFRKPRVQKFFRAAKYSGIFAPVEGRWWRTRLYKAAQDLFRKQDGGGPAPLAFAAAFRAQFNVRLNPAVCVYSRTTPADAVCYVLAKPVKREYSLAYYPDTRPPIMDEARVSFKAIRESDVLDELFDEQGQQLLAEIRKSTK